MVNGWDGNYGLGQRIAQYANIWPNYYLDDRMERTTFMAQKQCFGWLKRDAKKCKKGDLKKGKGQMKGKN